MSTDISKVRVGLTGAFSKGPVGSAAPTNATSPLATPAISVPTLNAPTTATTGGTLAAGTYYYKITATNAAGETTGSNEVSITTTGTTSTAGLSWSAISGATGYKIYRSTTAGGESTSPALVATLGAVTSYTDTGAATSAGSVPASNTTGVASAYTDTGAISEDGVTLTMPDSGDKNTIKMWQGGAQVRTLRTASEDLPSVQLTFLETNKTAVETYFGVTVTQTANHGTFDIVGGVLPDPFAAVLDVIDGSNIHRWHFPRVVKASVGDLVYKNDEPIGYSVTLELEKDATAGYNFRAWMTDLKS